MAVTEYFFKSFFGSCCQASPVSPIQITLPSANGSLASNVSTRNLFITVLSTNRLTNGLALSGFVFLAIFHSVMVLAHNGGVFSSIIVIITSFILFYYYLVNFIRGRTFVFFKEMFNNSWSNVTFSFCVS